MGSLLLSKQWDRVRFLLFWGGYRGMASIVFDTQGIYVLYFFPIFMFPRVAGFGIGW